MEFRDYAANETSALVTRLLATQSEASLQQLCTLREALDATTRAVEGATPQINDEVQDLVKRLTNAAASAVRVASQRVRDEAQTAVDAARGELEVERSQNAILVASVEKVDAEAAALRAELQAESDRADSAQRDLSAVLEAHKHLEAAHQEVQAAYNTESEARASAENELREARGLLDAAFDDAARLGELLQAEAAESGVLKGELAEARAEHERLDAARAIAEATAAEEVQARASAEIELEEAQASLDAALAEDARLGAQLEMSAAEKGKLLAALSAAQGELQTAQEQREAIAAQLKASSARVHTLERSQAKYEENVRQLQARLDTALESAVGFRERAVTDDRETAGAQAEIETLRGEVDRLVSLFDASVRGVDDLGSATTIAELLAALVKQLATQFSRVALFRVKGNRLEGVHQVGFDSTTDVTKLVMPLSMDSPLTRVVSSGAIENLTGSELADGGGVPFAGAPGAALALPVVLQDETLAVVYAEHADQPAGGPTVHESSARFAKLLVRQSVVLLMRLSHELKALGELRDYATMLLREAEQMHAADVDAGKSGDELRSRLKDSLDCARQLYAQRAALEGPTAASLLDEQITAVFDAQPSTPFARDLAALVGHVTGTDSRRAAEAS